VKIVMEYDGDTETQEARRAFQALDLALCLWDIEQELRRRYKWSEDGAEIKIMEELRDKFYEILGDHNIALGNLIS